LLIFRKILLSCLLVSLLSAPLLLTSSPQLALASETRVANLHVTTASPEQISLAWDAPTSGSESPTDYVITLRYAGVQKTLVYKDGVRTEPEFTTTDFPLGTALKFSVTPVFDTTKGIPARIRVSARAAPEPMKLSDKVARQMRYIAAHYADKSAKRWGYIPKNNCANFASQTLAARGLKQTELWHNKNGFTWNFSRTWVSSTALSRYLLAQPGAKQFTYGQIQKVQIGDLAFFDWDSSGDRDHSAIVTAVMPTENGPKIFYASHTAHGRYQSVELAKTLLHPGGKVFFVHPSK
jgi:hypothetical protein